MQQTIRIKFEQMGARVKLFALPGQQASRSWNQWRPNPVIQREGVRIDIARDNHGEYFEIRRASGVRVEVLDICPQERHLLLMARDPGQAVADAGRFLCGFDERAWFVAAIPETAAVRDVQGAKDALKPPEVWEAMKRFGVPPGQRDRRRTAAFVRQGEWFFIPRYDVSVSPRDVLRNEPIQRGAGKPHICQFLWRDGGEVVYVCDAHPDGLTEREYQTLHDRGRFEPWRVMRRNARVLVRGNIRHADHATVSLAGWHEVVLNTESQARAMEHVAFLD